MRYPEFLDKNGKIGFIAPSFGCTTEPYRSRFLAALDNFKSEGFGTIVGPNCFEEKGVGKSNTAVKCAEEINDFFTADRSNVLISCGGGETMCEDLSFVDFEAIAKARPKWFMGYSDNTNLTFTLPVLCDTAAIYGPCAGAFGEESQHKSVVDALNLLTGKILCQHSYNHWEYEGFDPASAEAENFPVPVSLEEIPGSDGEIKAVFPFSMRIADGKDGSFAGYSDASAVFSGRLLGGCIDILSILCGTRFDRVKEFCKKYENDGIVWFLECCDLDPVSLRRVLWQLKEAGWFSTAKGFIFGRPMRYGKTAFGMSFDDAVLSVLGKFGVPVIADADIGHVFPMMPLICGAMADVSAGPSGLEIGQRLV